MNDVRWICSGLDLIAYFSASCAIVVNKKV